MIEQLRLSHDWSSSLDERDLRQHLYLGNQPWLARLPDHVFDLSFKEAQAQGLKDGMLATAALRLLATHYLEVQHGHVHVRLDLFGEWQQSVLSRVSGLPIIAAMRAMHVGRGGHLGKR